LQQVKWIDPPVNVPPQGTDERVVFDAVKGIGESGPEQVEGFTTVGGETVVVAGSTVTVGSIGFFFIDPTLFLPDLLGPGI